MTARDYRKHIPRMGLSPELHTDERVFVVAFRGRVKLPGVAGGGGRVDENGPVGPPLVTPDEGTGVVCVVSATERTIYVNVDTTGITP